MGTFREKLKDSKGFSSIELAIILFLFVMLIAFSLDVIVIANKHYTVSQQANIIARQISVQGGLRTSTPTGFPGGNKAYYTSSELYNSVNESLKDIGINGTEWSGTIKVFNADGSVASSSSFTTGTSVKADYNKKIEINISYKSKWNAFGQFINKNDYFSNTVTRHGRSEFKYDYDSWGE